MRWTNVCLNLPRFRSSNAADRFAALVPDIGDGLPNPRQYESMSNLALDIPESKLLARLNPFSPAYRQAALDLYLSLREHADRDYVVARDEASSGSLPDDLWRDLIPWSFRDARLVSEHVLAWGNILRHLNVPPGGAVLEYGPGSGQILLMLARLGYRAHGVDIDPVALESIRAQAAHLNLPVATERAAFGFGFDDEKFDAILFYEAFHHAFDFDALLLRLHDKLTPGGRIVLCGEPIAAAPHAALPYPWGPRLDAISVFCMRRFGWMELGFTHDFFVAVARSAGWRARRHRFPGCPRATVYVLEAAPSSSGGDAAADWKARAPLRLVKNRVIEARRALMRLKMSGAGR